MKRPDATAGLLHTLSCRARAPLLTAPQLKAYAAQLPGWVRTGRKLHKIFPFANYYETMAFVNAVAFIAHQQDHHPDLSVHYNRVGVTYSTHDAGGITLNDCICAARVDELLRAP